MKPEQLEDDAQRLVRRAYERYFVDGVPEVDQSAEFRRCLARARRQEERARDLRNRDAMKAVRS